MWAVKYMIYPVWRHQRFSGAYESIGDKSNGVIIWYKVIRIVMEDEQPEQQLWQSPNILEVLEPQIWIIISYHTNHYMSYIGQVTQKQLWYSRQSNSGIGH